MTNQLPKDFYGVGQLQRIRLKAAGMKAAKAPASVTYYLVAHMELIASSLAK